MKSETPEFLLLHGIRNLIRCDSADVVSELASYMFSQYRSLRLLSRLVEAGRGWMVPSAVTLLGALKAFLMVRTPARGDGALWVARLANERREIAVFLPRAPDLASSEVRLNWSVRVTDVLALARDFGATLPRIMRIMQHLHRRYESFKVLRVAELLGYYMRYLRIFESGRYSLAVMSSHSNPHGIAFNLAARRCGVPVVLITHGMPVRPVARLSYDLGVVHCEEARQTYDDEGCRIGRVLIHGRRQHVTPMPEGPLPRALTVGVFLCKDVSEDRLRALLEYLLASPRVSRILVRAHPFNMWVGLRSWIAACGDVRLSLSEGGEVFQDIETADIVLAGNTSVHIEAVMAGRPSGFVPGLDHATRDLHRFVASGLIYELAEPLHFDPDAMLRFYRAPEWPTVLRRFANVDEDQATVTARTADIMRAVALSARDSAPLAL